MIALTNSCSMYDIFISYAQLDDHDDWVKLFKGQLQGHVDRLLTHKKNASFFFDLETIGGQRTLEIIGEAVPLTQTMVVLLSPSYLKSKWCMLEIQQFADHCGDAADDRIFLVALEPLLIDKKPLPVREKIGFPFHTFDEVQKTVPIRSEAGSDNYKIELNRLHREIVEQLAAMQETSISPRNEPEGVIFLAQDSCGVTPTCRQLADAFGQLGFRVVPEKQFFHAPDGFDTELEAAIRDADVVVQVLGNEDYPEIPDKFPDGYQAWISARAESLAKRVMRWHEKGVQVASHATQSYKDLFDSNTYSNSPEEFRGCVIEAVHNLRNKQRAIDGTNSGGPKKKQLVLVHTDPIDKDLARNITEQLEQQDLDYWIEDRCSVDKAAIALPYDGLIMLYGRCSYDDARSRAYQYVRLKLEHETDVPIGAIYIGEPEDKPPLDFNLSLLDIINYQRPEELDRFVSKVKEQGVAS